MRLVHTADLHVTAGPRLVDQAETLTAMVTAMIATRPDIAILAGDLFGHEVPHRSTPDERAVLYPAVAKLAAACPVVIVQGNHDDPTDIAALAHLSGNWPITVATRAGVVDVLTPQGIHATVYMLPYPTKRWLLADRENAPRSLAEAHTAASDRVDALLRMWSHRMRRERAATIGRPQILVAHGQVAGARTAGGEVLATQEIEIRRDTLDAMPLDYGALGHIHLGQEPAERCHYPGSPVRQDFSETDAKGWNLVDIAAPGDDGAWPDDLGACKQPAASLHVGDFPRLSVRVRHRANACREFRTLIYRWAADSDSGIAPDSGPVSLISRWVTRPTDAEIAACANAEVRARVTVPEQWVATMPWADEMGRLRAAGAVRIQEERIIEPALRVARAPEVATAPSLSDQVRAYWSTLAKPPDATEHASALERLDELASEAAG